ncbi:hypothetical protein BO86DRAFT_131468 [Aspergillus japonicus CBS 114.51]|uniref:Uncharacterized protein n=1 Tax=Aspergillus japonicus CBS 114.51 TaxID=1448312 RepID=A0A8T8WY05_ASPJA|nr:hypothetical protein BO86DRAFT_131468 [Aspergillus japonicus CBS 114.51]RAH80272.1 hypothetical protein BO86DRAFT_131468 [Aspergillus japonicus CBS 114.51]
MHSGIGAFVSFPSWLLLRFVPPCTKLLHSLPEYIFIFLFDPLYIMLSISLISQRFIASDISPFLIFPTSAFSFCLCTYSAFHRFLLVYYIWMSFRRQLHISGGGGL